MRNHAAQYTPSRLSAGIRCGANGRGSTKASRSGAGDLVPREDRSGRPHGPAVPHHDPEPTLIVDGLKGKDLHGGIACSPPVKRPILERARHARGAAADERSATPQARGGAVRDRRGDVRRDARPAAQRRRATGTWTCQARWAGTARYRHLARRLCRAHVPGEWTAGLFDGEPGPDDHAGGLGRWRLGQRAAKVEGRTDGQVDRDTQAVAGGQVGGPAEAG